MNVVIDSGGTTTRIAFSQNKKNFSDILKYPTPKKFQDYKGLLQSVITKNIGNEPIENLVYGVAGSVNRYEKTINKSPHNNCLNNKKITDILDFIDFNSTKVFFENDASLAALAEAILGEGKNYNRVAYITISTGVGGALIKEKRISDTNYNFEPGHHIINFEGEALALENIKGSFESYSSGTGFKARYGVDPADHDDPVIWNDYGNILGIGLHNISLLWQPEIIVLGGSMSKKANLFIKALNSSLEKTLLNTPPEIKVSNLGDENGLIGGLELLNLTTD